jgi:hypothetical protein
MNRIVTIVIWKKSPVVPGVKLSWRSAKTAAEILHANSGSAEPGGSTGLCGIFFTGIFCE